MPRRRACKCCSAKMHSLSAGRLYGNSATPSMEGALLGFVRDEVYNAPCHRKVSPSSKRSPLVFPKPAATIHGLAVGLE